MAPSSKRDREVKHVSRACLECRSRHLKCDGKEPKCTRCEKFNRECQYVKSNRGGSRKKGVSTKKQKLDNGNSDKRRSKKGDTDNKDNEVKEELGDPLLSAKNHKNGHKHSDEMDSFVLPCVQNGLPEMADRDICNSQCLKKDVYNKLPPCLTGVKPKTKKEKEGIDFHPTFNSSKEKNAIDVVFDRKYYKSNPDDYYITPALIRNIDVESIVNTYYNCFHKTHPFMPPLAHIMEYLDSIPYKYDLLLAMKLVGDGQANNLYSKDVESVVYLVTNIMDYTKQVGKDLVSLQTILLLGMVTHISSLLDLSVTLRETLVSLCLELKLNYIDEDEVPSVFMDVNGFITESDNDNKANKNGVHMMHTPSETGSVKGTIHDLQNTKRTMNIPRDILVDTARRTLWEIYFFDTLSGTASGQSTSLIASQKMLCFYPKSVPLATFDYKSRAESCKLVNDAIKLNVAIQANKNVQTHLVHMNAAIGNWDMRIENPDMFKAPYLVNAHGQVNEGVFQSIMLVNYAKIFTHRPNKMLIPERSSRLERLSILLLRS
ncbi:unnamed protein product [Ambrosiozyma monospora]|uniref:Unnamed protein product n=1 Tax=Ambrosiozyma monospora TaxID=43982 RepID=A0ACB5T652_AMBMO|nr:unnamed protein product [Ambrosiozyma monospora]